jgi:hypothetical protein
VSVLRPNLLLTRDKLVSGHVARQLFYPVLPSLAETERFGDGAEPGPLPLLSIVLPAAPERNRWEKALDGDVFPMKVDPEVVVFVRSLRREWTRKIQTVALDDPERKAIALDGHLVLLVLEIASRLANMEGLLTLRREDFELSWTIVVETCRENRSRLIEMARAQMSREDDEKQFERDGRTARSRAFVEQSLVPELRFWGIFSRVRSLGSKSVGRRDLGRIDGRFRRPPAGTDADVLARWQDGVLELLTAAVARGWIEMATLTNRKGNFDVAVTVTDFPDRPPAS